MFEKGMVYVVDAPLYFYRTDKGRLQGDSLASLKSQVTRFDSTRVTRLKGWGEAAGSDLRDIAFNPTSRVVKQITKLEKNEVRELIGMLGEDVDFRRKAFGLD
jgi:DNA gyrase/topoisomerase IV subunit B